MRSSTLRLRSLLLLFAVFCATVMAHAEPTAAIKDQKRQIQVGTGVGGIGGSITLDTSTTDTTSTTSTSSTSSTSTTSTTSDTSTSKTSTSDSSTSDSSSTSNTSKTTLTTPLVQSSTIAAATTTFVTSSDGNQITITSTSSSVVSSTTGFATITSTPGLVDNGSGGNSSGLSLPSKKIIGGVVGGVGGAIFLGALALVAFRIWGRKRRTTDEDDYLGGMGTGAQTLQRTEKRTPSNSQLASDDSYADRYTSPVGRPNAAANF